MIQRKIFKSKGHIQGGKKKNLKLQEHRILLGKNKKYLINIDLIDCFSVKLTFETEELILRYIFMIINTRLPILTKITSYTQT